MRAIGYLRVSTDKQADLGVSLEAQSAKVRAMAVVQGTELLDVIVDAESAKSLDRPGMARLLEMVDRREVDTVIIAKLDRITRSVKAVACGRVEISTLNRPEPKCCFRVESTLNRPENVR